MELQEVICLKSSPTHKGRTEREERRRGGLCRVIWCEIRGERRTREERETERHERERRDE